jgi:hypothetical protein
MLDYFYDCSCQLKTATYYLISTNGTNQIMLAGIGTIDSLGIFIRNINLQELLYVTPSLPPSQPVNPNPQPTSKPPLVITQPINFWNLSNVITDSQFSPIFYVFSSLQNLPVIGWAQRILAMKQCFRFIFGLALELHHLLPYSYHRSNFTLTANIYLAGMRALDDERAYIIDTYVYPLFTTSPKAIVSTFESRSTLPVSMNNLYPTFMQRPNSAAL